MMKITAPILLLLSSAVSSSAQHLRSPNNNRVLTTATNLLVNGSFEDTPMTAGTWAHFDAKQIPGWKSLNGERIELWGTGHRGVPSQDGVNHLEIDYHRTIGKLDAIYQDIQTKDCQKYEASFYIRARSHNFDSEDETAVFSWNGAETSFTAKKEGVWTKVSVIVEGTGGLDRFLIRESSAAGASNSLGPLIDNVSLVEVDMNLLVNGSFEETPMKANSWAHFDATEIPGWKSLNGERIELWGTGLLGVKSQDGVNHLEIDYRGSTDHLDAVYQDIQTVRGKEYEASFYLRARRHNFNSEDETAVFSWNGEETAFTAEKEGVWIKISVIVQGTGGLDRFMIRESSVTGASNGLGPLIDNVRLVPVCTKCFLRNLDTQQEEQVTEGYSYSPGSSGRFSIRCDVVGKYDYSKWLYNGETSDDWNAPFWLKNNDDESDKVWDADYLTTCGHKSITFEAYKWSSHEFLVQKTLEFEALCN